MTWTKDEFEKLYARFTESGLSITSVADATKVVCRAIEDIKVDPQVVDASTLNSVLQELKSEIQQVNLRLAQIERKLDIETPCTPEEPVDPYNGHEYVDLGVVVEGKPVYWATTNIGAELPADYGLYFAWGENVGYTKEDHKFDWANYSSELCGGAYNKMKKYCTDSSYGTVDNKTVLEPEDDAAHVNWQGVWRMPTKEEQDALREQCDWTWTSMTNSVGVSIDGFKVSDKTDCDKFIFLPVAGYRLNDYLYNAGSSGFYWSSSLSAYDSSRDDYLNFDSDNSYWSRCTRYYGFSIRPVCL